MPAESLVALAPIIGRWRTSGNALDDVGNAILMHGGHS
jgi:hypothetical protein